MRITTNMLNESARKAGLPINNTSLLNYVNNANAENTLLNALNQKNEGIVNAERKSTYEKLDKEAKQLMQSAKALINNGENNLFEKAKVGGDNKNIYTTIENFVIGYNNTLKNLEENPNTMNDFYRSMLIEASKDLEKSLSDVGLTFSKSGKTSIDMDKVKKTDIGQLEKLFGKESNFMNRIEFLASRVSDYAEAGIRSISNAYNANGNMNDYLNSSRYEFWG